MTNLEPKQNGSGIKTKTQTSRTENPKINPQTIWQQIVGRTPGHDGEMMVSFMSSASETILTCQRIKLDHSFSSYTKGIKITYKINLQVRPETTKLSKLPGRKAPLRWPWWW